MNMDEKKYEGMYSKFFLLPSTTELKDKFDEIAAPRLLFINRLCIAFSFIDFVFELIVLISQLVNGEIEHKVKLNVYLSLALIVIFIAIWLVGIFWKQYHVYCVALIPLFFSVVITEKAEILGLEGYAFYKILSDSGFLMFFMGMLPINCIYILALSLLYFLYPTLRTLEINQMQLNLLLSSCIGFCIGAYLNREEYIKNICNFFVSQTTQDLWKKMLLNLPLGFVIISAKDGKCLFRNQVVFDLLDIPSEYADRKDIFDVIYQEDCIQNYQTNSNLEFMDRFNIKVIINNDERNAKYMKLSQVFNECANQHQINYFLEINSKLIEIRINNITIDNAEAKLISFMDFSSIHKIETLQQENKYKTMMMSTISHELRTPINAVVNSIELIKMYVPEDKQKLVKIVEDSCQLILFHVNDFTDYGKLSQQNIVLNFEWVNVKKLLFSLE